MTITENELRDIIRQSLNEEIQEGKFGGALAGLGLASMLALTTPSCSYVERNEPNVHWEHEGPYSAQEKMDKTWNNHQKRGDWNNIEQGVGFIYDIYSRCAKSGGGWDVCVIFADKTTGRFILPQECRKYLNGRYVPNCNCFENENTTDRINTNGLQRLDSSENITVFENKNMKQRIRLNESQLRNIIKEGIKKVLRENVDGNEQLEEIFRDVNIKADQYRQYAEQLEYDLQKIETICNDIVDAINNTFGVSITTKDFRDCMLDDGLYFTIYIPVQNFLNGCKNNYDIMRSFKTEKNQNEQTLLEYGLNEEWGNNLFTSDGAQVGDKWHKFSFLPRDVKSGMVECAVEISNAFKNYN